MKKIMPALFVGHGSPMNALEDNSYSQNWKEIAKELPKPQAILAISAHWYTKGTNINDMENPRTLYDFYGFPKELYEVEYPAPGSPKYAHITKDILSKEVKIDNSWGIDHGTWSVLHRMYPNADVPVYQLSIDRNAPLETHYKLGQEISTLREDGVMILGSGNVVHNLSRVNWEMENGYPWADQFDDYIKHKIIERNHRDVIQYQSAGASSALAFQTEDHFCPLLYVLGATREDDRVSIYNDTCTLGSLSMTSYLFQ
ncbi:MAG: ligB2 [Herbinix sp.]|jgi:4,5-DOPA dioxygenase extradiol|nr:ligB2 [Herbinix sp.]